METVIYNVRAKISSTKVMADVCHIAYYYAQFGGDLCLFVLFLFSVMAQLKYFVFATLYYSPYTPLKGCNLIFSPNNTTFYFITLAVVYGQKKIVFLRYRTMQYFKLNIFELYTENGSSFSFLPTGKVQRIKCFGLLC